jgi:hypothetical protein
MFAVEKPDECARGAGGGALRRVISSTDQTGSCLLLFILFRDIIVKVN